MESSHVLDLADVPGRALMGVWFDLAGLLGGECSTGLLTWLLFLLSRAVGIAFGTTTNREIHPEK
jgi:hypothetical protein